MSDFNNYWPVYKNLEEETLQLAKYIYFSDDQLSTYSMHIADLIIRIVIEIESISKDLYRINGGPDLFDDNGKKRNLFFDTDCIKYLNNIWRICDREIIVSCTYFYFEEKTNTIIKPLKNAFKNGDRSSKWNKAYQAVKHDRRNNLKRGNIGNLIQALGALYILNIYYQDEKYKNENTILLNDSFDNRLGSEIFAATFIDASKVAIGIDKSINAINTEEREKINSAICIIKYTDEVWKNLHDEFSNFNNEIAKNVLDRQDILKKITNKIESENIDGQSINIKEIISELQSEYITKHPPIKLGKMMSGGKKEIVLNKGQTIYKEEV